MTKACVAKMRGDRGQFDSGVYVNSDGYPSGVGQVLFTLHKRIFDGDVGGLLHALMQHPVWSTIHGDWRFGPVDFRDAMANRGNPNYDDAPQYHGDVDSTAKYLNPETAIEAGIDYLYLVDDDCLEIWKPMSDVQRRANVTLTDVTGSWVFVMTVNLYAEEAPDWYSITKWAHKM